MEKRKRARMFWKKKDSAASTEKTEAGAGWHKPFPSYVARLWASTAKGFGQTKITLMNEFFKKKRYIYHCVFFTMAAASFVDGSSRQAGCSALSQEDSGDHLLDEIFLSPSDDLHGDCEDLFHKRDRRWGGTGWCSLKRTGAATPKNEAATT